MRRPVYAYACIRPVYAASGHACAYALMRTHALEFLSLYFQKIDLFYS